MRYRVLTYLALAACLWPALVAASTAEIAITPAGGGDLVSADLGDTLALEVVVDAGDEEITGIAVFISYEAEVFRLVPSTETEDGAVLPFTRGEFLDAGELLNRSEERGGRMLLSYVVAAGVQRRTGTGQGVVARFRVEVARRPVDNAATISIDETSHDRTSHYLAAAAPGEERLFGRPLGSLTLQITGFKIRPLPDVVVLESELDTLFQGQPLDEFVVQDEAEVMWSVAAAPELGTVIDADHRVTMNPQAGFVGEYSATFTALEMDEGNEDSADLTVRVRSRPRIRPLPESVVFDEDGASQPLGLDTLVYDRDHEVAGLTWVASGGQFVRATIDPQRQLTFTSEPNWSGAEAIRLTVTDSTGLTAADSIRVTVRAVNDPPQVLHRPPVYPVLGEGAVSIPLTELFVDVDDDLANLQILHPSEAAVVAELSKDHDSLLVTGLAVGRGVIQLVVRDRAGDGDVGRLVAVVLPRGGSVKPEILPLPTLRFSSDDNGNLPLADLVRDDGPTSELEWTTAPDSGLQAAHVVDGGLVVSPELGFSGPSSVLLSVRDADENADASRLDVVVLGAEGDPSPQIHAPGRFGVVSDQGQPPTSVALDPLVADPNHDDPEITWTAMGSDDITASVDAQSRTLLLTATPGLSGLHSVVLVAQDPTGRTDTAAIPVLAVRPGEGPGLTPFHAVSLDSLGATARIDLDELAFDDVDLCSELYWTAEVEPGIEAELDPVSHLLRIRRADADAGPATPMSRVVLKVVDTNGNEAFGVLEVSLPPAFKLRAIPDITFYTGAVDTTLRLDEYVVESDPQYPLEWSVADPLSLVAELDTVSTRVSLGVRNPGFVGAEVITFAAADGTGRSRTASVRVIVKGRGLVPQVRQFPVLQILAGDTDTSIDLDEFVVDDDADPELIWTHNEPDSLEVVVDSITRGLAITVAEGATGSRQIQLLVRDPAGNSALSALDVVIMRGGDPPVIAPLPQLFLPAGGQEQALALDLYASDPDTPIEQIAWQVIAQPGVAARVDERKLLLRVPAEQTGVRQLTLTATDPEGNQAEAQLVVLIQVDDEPPEFGIAVRRESVSDDILRISITPSESLTGDLQVLLAGTSQPATVTDDGSYEVTYQVPDVPGNQLLTISVRGTDGAGNEGTRDLGISLRWITEDGGSLRSADGFASLNVPDMAMGQGRLITIRALAGHEIPPGNDDQPAYAVDLIGAQAFEYPVAVNLRVGAMESDGVGVLRWNEVTGIWEEQPTLVDAETGWLTVAIDEPGVFRPGAVEAENLRASSKLANHPNPFPTTGVSGTLIEYELTDPGPVQIDIINALGQCVRSLVDEDYQDVGVWTVLWDGRSEGNDRLAGGVYFCRLRERASTHLHRMLLIR